jgi:hypothetical protein
MALIRRTPKVAHVAPAGRHEPSETYEPRTPFDCADGEEDSIRRLDPREQRVIEDPESKTHRNNDSHRSTEPRFPGRPPMFSGHGSG